MDLQNQLKEKIGLYEVKQLVKNADKEEIFAFLFDNDQSVCVNAAWILTHLPKTDNKWLESKRNELIEETMRTNNISKRRLCLALLERLPMQKQDIRTDFLDFCLQESANPNNPTGILTLCMKLAYKQCIHYTELTKELKEILELTDKNFLSEGANHQREKILKELNKL